jgi:hypothetical protein
MYSLDIDLVAAEGGGWDAYSPERAFTIGDIALKSSVTRSIGIFVP